jgi:AcrR family transcriptional regulator
VTSDGARDRLAQAAFTQFATRGFDATTVEQIAEAAGVSRRTFFRYFATKEDVIFPEHDRLRAAVATELERRRSTTPLVAVCDAVGIVLEDYVANREVSLLRFSLTRSVTALREREVTSVHRYQRLFAGYLRDNLDDVEALTTELMAASVVTAHNSVLRDWLLSGAKSDPGRALAAALDYVQTVFAKPAAGDVASNAAVAVFTVDTPMPEIIDAIHRLNHRNVGVTR